MNRMRIVYALLCALGVVISSDASEHERKQVFCERDIDAPQVYAALNKCICAVQRLDGSYIFPSERQYSLVGIIIEYCMSSDARYATITQIPAEWSLAEFGFTRELRPGITAAFCTFPREGSTGGIQWNIPLDIRYKRPLRKPPSPISPIFELHDFDRSPTYHDKTTGWTLTQTDDGKNLLARKTEVMPPVQYHCTIPVFCRATADVLLSCAVQKVKGITYLYIVKTREDDGGRRARMRRDILPSAHQVYTRGALITDYMGMLTTYDMLGGKRYNRKFELRLYPHDSDCTLASSKLVYRDGYGAVAQRISHGNDFVIVECGRNAPVYYLGNDHTIQERLFWHKRGKIRWSAGYYIPGEAVALWAQGMACMSGVILGSTFFDKKGLIVRNGSGCLMGAIMGGAAICATDLWPNNYMTQRILQPLEKRFKSSPMQGLFWSTMGLLMEGIIANEIATLLEKRVWHTTNTHRVAPSLPGAGKIING